MLEPLQVDDVVVPERPLAAAEQRLIRLDDPGLAWIWAGERRERTPLAGSPGMRRGSRKLSVSATQMAKT